MPNVTQNTIIKLEDVSKTFEVHKRELGFAASVKSLFKRTYTSIDAVRNISFELYRGEIVGFIGSNGAGKTTTLKMLGFIQILSCWNASESF